MHFCSNSADVLRCQLWSYQVWRFPAYVSHFYCGYRVRPIVRVAVWPLHSFKGDCMQSPSFKLRLGHTPTVIDTAALVTISKWFERTSVEEPIFDGVLQPCSRPRLLSPAFSLRFY